MEQKLSQDLPLGKVLRKMRLYRQKTQHDVAVQLQLCGYPITERVYGNIERGKRYIHIRELIALKKIFQVSYEDFFQELEKEIVPEED